MTDIKDTTACSPAYKDKKRLLFASLLLPYSLSTGYGMHFFYYIKLVSAYCNVTLVCFSDGESGDVLGGLKPYCERIITVEHCIRATRHKIKASYNIARSFFSSFPCQLRKCYSARMKQVINDVLQESDYDAVCAVDLGMAQYFTGREAPIKVVFKTYREPGYYSDLSRYSGNPAVKYFASAESAKLKASEAAVLRCFDRIAVLTEDDSSYYRGILGEEKRYHVIPVAVDREFFSPQGQSPPQENILLAGDMLWYPNFDQVNWFLDEIFPLLEASRPGIRLTIVGSGVTGGLFKKAKGRAVFFAGHKEDIRPYFKEASLLAAPVRICGGGIRTKILSALACGVPVISTPQACKGAGFIPGEHLITANSPGEFKKGILELLDNQDLQRKIRAAGLSLIRERFSPDEVGLKLKAALT